MNKTYAKSEQTNQVSLLSQKWVDYQLLVKFRLSSLVVFSAVMAYLIAAGSSASWVSICVLTLGGFLVTGASNALNQVLEKDYDKLMKRTENRPLAAGRMENSEAVMAAGFMSLFGIVLLALFNPWTAFLGTCSLLLYSFVYTPMKRISPIAVLIGAVPGALPTMIGVVAFEGTITALALVLFGIQFLWQFPHFWAIAWLGHDDYTNAGFKLLPSKSGREDKNTARQAFIYTLLLLPLSFVPYLMGICGIVSAYVVFVLALIYAYYGFEFFRWNNRKTARQLMFCSFFYLPLVLIAFVIDKI